MAHMHYKGTGKVHSFRGVLADGDQDKIRIQGPVGAIAWRIVKFELMPKEVGDVVAEHVVKIYRELQSSVTGVVDFSDSELLAAGFVSNDTSAHAYPPTQSVIFDRDLFSRNIYVTHKDRMIGGACNYYIELEEIKLSKAGMAQLAVAAARRTI